MRTTTRPSIIATILIVRGFIIREVYDSPVTTFAFRRLSHSHRGFSPVSKRTLTPGTVLNGFVRALHAAHSKPSKRLEIRGGKTLPTGRGVNDRTPQAVAAIVSFSNRNSATQPTAWNFLPSKNPTLQEASSGCCQTLRRVRIVRVSVALVAGNSRAV